MYKSVWDGIQESYKSESETASVPDAMEQIEEGVELKLEEIALTQVCFWCSMLFQDA